MWEVRKSAVSNMVTVGNPRVFYVDKICTDNNNKKNKM
jgi:hypothetical protein